MSAVLCNEGLVLIVVGIIGMIDGLRLLSVTANEPLGPGWYLILLSIILLFGGAYNLILDLKSPTEKKNGFSFRFGPAAFAITAMLIYSLAVSYLGYLVCTIAFLIAGIRIFGERSWIKSASFASLTGLAFWFIFVFLAEIPMP